MLAEIAAALSGNEAHKAELLATTALAASDLTALQKTRLQLNRGLALELQGAHAGALGDLTQAIDAHVLPQAEQAFALFERGMALDGLGRLADALKDYDASITLAPGSAPALNNRANVLRRLSRLEEARRDYLASIAAGNAQPEYPYYGLGQVAEGQNDTAAARDYYAKAVAANARYKLAADRLEALGGPLAKADDGVIHLRPPKGMETAAMTSATPPAPTPGPARIPAVPPLPDPSSAPRHLRSTTDLARAATAPAPLRPAIMDKAAVSGPQVQLGSWRQEADASQAWDRAVKQAGEDLAGLTPRIVAVDLPGRGRYYRLRVQSDSGATRLCASLAAKGLDCLPVRD
jgi:tetratricopeptide (TPR) repeat protein